MRAEFDLDNSYPYYEMLKQRFSGKNDSWAILWWYAVFKAGGLVLYPKRSLVWVGGFDGSGTHCGTSELKLRDVEDLWQFPAKEHLRFPDCLKSDDGVFTRIKDFLRLQHKKTVMSKILSFFRIQ
jgi:hypothetical protein